MGLLSPSFSVVLYEASVEDGDAFVSRAVEALESHCFDPKLAGSSEMASGWSVAYQPYPARISHEEVVFGNYLHFAMIVEKRRVPAALVKKHLALEEAKLLAQQGRSHISRKELKELGEKVKLSLLAKTLPIPAVHECAWNLASGRLYLFGGQEKVMESFEELFHATFSIRPRPVTAGTLAWDWARRHGRSADLERIEPEALS